jgi:TonB family protein
MPPRYPPSMCNQKLEGRAVILFIVDTTGRVIEARIEEASHPDFGKAAVDAILKWRFEPGLKDGQRVKFKMRIPIPFRL